MRSTTIKISSSLKGKLLPCGKKKKAEKKVAPFTRRNPHFYFPERETHFVEKQKAEPKLTSVEGKNVPVYKKKKKAHFSLPREKDSAGR